MHQIKRILCCTPLSWKYVSADYHDSVLKMNNYGVRNSSFHLAFTRSNNPYIDAARDDLAKRALGTKMDYFLWLDADQIYPPHTPEVLMRHVDAGRLVVGGVTPRREDGLPLIHKRVGNRYSIAEEVPAGKLFKVDALGMGGVMTHRSVFDKVKLPCFMLRWRDNEPVGEDFSFYERCHEAGIDVWCDTTLQYGHMDVRPIHLTVGKQ